MLLTFVWIKMFDLKRDRSNCLLFFCLLFLVLLCIRLPLIFFHNYADTHVHRQTGLCCSCCFFVVVLEVSRSCVSSCLTETLPLPFPNTAVCFMCCKNEMCLRLTRKTRNTEATSTTWTVSREGMSNSFYTIGHIQPTLILNVF